MPLRSLCASTALLMVATIAMATPAIADPSDDYMIAARQVQEWIADFIKTSINP